MTVRLVAEYTGRGPKHARTHISENMITVVLEDTLTKGEHALIRDGRADLVLATRKAYQETMRDGLVSGVEEITGRTVRAFLSDHNLDPDVAIESFVLRPVTARREEL